MDVMRKVDSFNLIIQRQGRLEKEYTLVNTTMENLGRSKGEFKSEGI